MELVVFLLVLWAMLVPFRLVFTAWGVKKRGRKLFVAFLVCAGIADAYDVPDRVMQMVERYKRAPAGEARRDRARATEKALAGSDTPRGKESGSTLAQASNAARQREEAAARRARARYEAEQRRLEQSRTGQTIEREQRR